MGVSGKRHNPATLQEVGWAHVRYGQVQWRTQEFFSWGVQQIQSRTEDREDGDLGAVAP